MCLNEYPLLLIEEGFDCLGKERHWGLQWLESWGQMCQYVGGANVFPYSELHPSLGHSGKWCSHSGIAGHLSWDTSRRNGLFHNCSQHLGYDFPSFLIYLHVVHAVTLLRNLRDGHWMVLSLNCQGSVMKRRWETCTSLSASLSCQCEDAFKGSREGALQDLLS